MSSALSNFAGLTLSTWSMSTSRCCPSSVCTSKRPPSCSSKTSPLTKAFSGSRSQTYLFPEKSLSPSCPRIWSAPRRRSSVFMKSGANVPDATSFLREFDLCRLSFREKGAIEECEMEDEFRIWPLGSSNFPTDARTADLGRVFVCGLEDGDGEGDARPKGLTRFGEPLI
ncbi:hypothetical protein BDV06DRAFT_195351 [Aspergillus oleicola]